MRYRCDDLLMGVGMFESFLDEFRLLPPEQVAGATWREPRLLAVEGYEEFAARFAGCSFENGLYRLHDASSGPLALSLIAEGFPEFASRACPFGYDWLGRQFAIDAGRLQGGQPLVLLLEPGTGEGLEIPLPFGAFHDEELVEYQEAALATNFFDAWSQDHGTSLPLASGDCVGYRVPLFLGGRDAVDNLEVIDLDVYWTTCGQLRRGTLQLPDATSIKNVSRGLLPRSSGG
jgi:hypothetical protein